MPYRPFKTDLIYTGKKISLELRHLVDEQGREIVKEVCVHPGAVVILPVIDTRTVLLIRNWRHTIGQSLIELPAGTLEKGEDPALCAARELIEETGYKAGRLVPLRDFYASPGILTEKMRVFAAYDLSETSAAPEPGEEIERFRVSFEEAFAMIGDGRIQDGKTIATLLLFDRFFRNTAS